MFKLNFLENKIKKNIRTKRIKGRYIQYHIKQNLNVFLICITLTNYSTYTLTHLKIIYLKVKFSVTPYYICKSI